MEQGTTLSKQQAGTAASGGDTGFGRVVAGLFLLLLAFVAAVVFLTAAELIDTKGWMVLGVSLKDLLPLGRDAYGLGRVAVAAGSLLVGLVCLAMVFRGLASGAGAGDMRGRHILVADDKGMVMVETRGIVAVATAAVMRIRGVMDVQVEIIGQGASPIRLKLTTHISAAAEVKKVADEARLKALAAVESLVGIDVRESVAKVEVVPLEQVGRMLE